MFVVLYLCLLIRFVCCVFSGVGVRLFHVSSCGVHVQSMLARRDGGLLVRHSAPETHFEASLFALALFEEAGTFCCRWDSVSCSAQQSS